MADDEEVLRNPLSVEDDEYDVVHEPNLTGVLTVPTLEAARERAQRLVEHGLGATVAQVDEPPGFEVRVLPADAVRAAELLGGVAPDVPVAAGEDPGVPAPGKEPVPWRMLVAIWVAAMLLIPLATGFGAYLMTR